VPVAPALVGAVLVAPTPVVPTLINATQNEVPAELLTAGASPSIKLETVVETPPKHPIAATPELTATPFAPAAAVEAPKTDQPGDLLIPTPSLPALSNADIEARRKHAPPTPVAPLPPGANRVLGRAAAGKPSDFSVFEMPAVNDPKAPSTAQNFVPFPVMPRLQPSALPQDSVPVPDDVILWKSLQSHQEFMNPGHSLEERFGLKGILLLALSAGVLVFVLGYLLFSLLVYW